MENYIKYRTFYDEDNGGGGGTPPTIKTYNQDEVNGIIGSRLAQERAKIYKLLNVEDEGALKDIASQLKAKTDENATLKAEVENFKALQAKVEKTKQLTDAGIDADFVDVAIAKWDGKQDLAKFVEENPKLSKAYFETKGTGHTLDGKFMGGNVDLSKLSTEEFMEYMRKESK